MTDRKHRAYTLWMKFKNAGWTPRFTVETGRDQWPSPTDVIKDFMRGTIEYEYDDPNAYWKRGKTWVILPKGKLPAELRKLQEAA